MGNSFRVAGDQLSVVLAHVTSIKCPASTGCSRLWQFFHGLIMA